MSDKIRRQHSIWQEKTNTNILFFAKSMIEPFNLLLRVYKCIFFQWNLSPETIKAIFIGKKLRFELHIKRHNPNKNFFNFMLGNSSKYALSHSLLLSSITFSRAPSCYSTIWMIVAEAKIYSIFKQRNEVDMRNLKDFLSPYDEGKTR